MSKEEFIKRIKDVSYNKNTDEIFRDFCELSALSLAVPFYKEKVKDGLERIHKKYPKDEIMKLEGCFSLMVEDMEKSNEDYLGDVYGKLELSGRGKGDFFTPYHVSLMSARMTIGDVKEQLKTKPYLTVCEPACGAGGMVIAARQVFIEQGCNPSWDMFVTATDIAPLSFHMTYVQLSLYGISAEVIHGDTLAMTQYQSLYTPTVFLMPWAGRLMVKKMNNFFDEPVETKVEEKPEPVVCGQLSLF